MLNDMLMCLCVSEGTLTGNQIYQGQWDSCSIVSNNLFLAILQLVGPTLYCAYTVQPI